MRLSRLTKILTVASAAVLLAACGGNSGNSGGSSESPGGPVTLNWFMWSGSDVEKNAWLAHRRHGHGEVSRHQDQV